jgi:short-chain Z-isoprenyl diphosphate synthase
VWRHKYGAEHVEHLLRWRQAAALKHVTVYLCSTENLQRRDSDEVAYLMQLIEEMAARLPPGTVHALTDAVEASSGCATGANVTLAIGYCGRQELVDALRAALRERAHAGQTLAEAADDVGASTRDPDRGPGKAHDRPEREAVSKESI